MHVYDNSSPVYNNATPDDVTPYDIIDEAEVVVTAAVHSSNDDQSDSSSQSSHDVIIDVINEKIDAIRDSRRSSLDSRGSSPIINLPPEEPEFHKEYSAPLGASANVIVIDNRSRSSRSSSFSSDSSCSGSTRSSAHLEGEYAFMGDFADEDIHDRLEDRLDRSSVKSSSSSDSSTIYSRPTPASMRLDDNKVGDNRPPVYV